MGHTYTCNCHSSVDYEYCDTHSYDSNSITCKHSEKCCIMLPKVFANLPQTSWAPPFHLWHSWTLCQLTSLPFVAHTELHILYRPGWRLWQVITAPYQLFSSLVSFLIVESVLENVRDSLTTAVMDTPVYSGSLYTRQLPHLIQHKQTHLQTSSFFPFSPFQLGAGLHWRKLEVGSFSFLVWKSLCLGLKYTIPGS